MEYTYCLFCCNSQEQVLQVGKSVHFRSFELLAVGSERILAGGSNLCFDGVQLTCTYAQVLL